ncbi:hypothetical protein BDN71DRAFT_1007911 [Pleurotus eryngii]|uniref:RRM domain-containing protein n=1 Tax=Pleurotus eryngii TaxID=5323 RepID=A0A9P6DFT9_PLEER|nr:hypothetical protein BDN71DRAFT_1007911 [Pleurotus eryngii]
MDDSQSAFATHYQTYGFDIDMMKRSMEAPSIPDAKKPRWSPTSSFPSTSPTNGSHPQSATRDAFANYGYGPQASINQPQFASSPSSANFPNGSPLYSTPSLNINTHNGIGGMPQLSPSVANAFAAQQQQQQQQAQAQAQQQAQANGINGQLNGYANGFGGYSMLGMGLPGMNMLGFPYNGQMGNFAQNFNNQSRLPSLNIPAAQASYSPNALSAALTSPSNSTGRTVYIGNLPSTASVDELLNLVHFGPLENIRVLPEKSCVFLSFLDPATAAAFHADATIKKLSLHGQELKIGWGKASAVPAQVALAISQSGASRNVYLGGLEEGMTEERLRDELSRFGLIDQVKIVRDKNIGFVHFLSIATATKVVNTLPTEPAWAGKRVNYGKDRCAYVPKSQQVAAQQAQAVAAQTLVAQSAGLSSPQSAAFSPFSPYTPFTPNGVDMSGMANGGMNGMMAMNGMAMHGLGAMNGMGGVGQGMNRTVYLGNIHPETSTEDLCNAIRGGVLQSIRYMQDKHIAFVTFIDPAAALTFFQVSSYNGLTLNNRRLKIGWGKNSGPLPPTLALAVHSGATRNVYIGNIEDFDVFTDEKLKRDFGEYGEIELVNFLKEKNCAFVNFTSVGNAIKAIEGIKGKKEYEGLRIAHGKDRCANPPRSGGNVNGGHGRRNASGNNSAPNSAGIDMNGDLELENGDAYLNGDLEGDEGHMQPGMHVDSAEPVAAAA